MNIVRPNSFTIQALLVCLLLIEWPAIDGQPIHHDCTSYPQCDCLPGDEFEISCPRGNPQITVRAEMRRAEIECQVTSDDKIFEQLPTLDLRHVDMVKIKYCPMPVRTTIKGILDRLGIQRIQNLKFSIRSAISIGRQHMTGLTTLRNLQFCGPITHIADDSFDDIGNITALEIISSKVHLPMNLFHTLRELEQLDLGSNNIDSLEAGVFRNQTKLRSLNLWSNNLKNLTKETFSGATSVAELDISANNIETLQPDVFVHLTNMTNIHLSGNRFAELPAGLFAANKKLERIRLLNNRITMRTLPKGFLARLPQLETVMIQTGLEQLPDDMFAESERVQNVTLSRNALSTLPPALFANQTNLLDIDLESNNLIELPDQLFDNTRKLVVLRLSNNKLRHISADLFNALEMLQELYLDGNALQAIDKSAFAASVNLHTLHLENNELDFISRDIDGIRDDLSKLSPFQNLLNLRRLYLSNNSMSQFLADWNLHNAKLEVLDLSLNRIKSVRLNQITVAWNQPITVNLTGNQIQRIEAKEIAYVIEEMEFPKKAKEAGERNQNIRWNWHLNDNPLECDCDLLYFVKFINEIQRDPLNLVMDNMRCRAPSNLQNQLITDTDANDLRCTLDSFSSEKYCPDKCECWVQANTRTAIFNCSNADLSDVPALPNFKQTDKPTHARIKFIELNIENNRITTLPNRGAIGYDRVTKLYAKNNSLGLMMGENLPPNLTYLDISHNKLKTLNADALYRLNLSGSLEHLRLEGNQWVCDCNSDFMQFIRSHSDRIDYNNIRCSDGELLRDKDDVCPINKTILFLVCILIALFGLFIGTVFALYYKYQQEVKVWLFARGLCLWFVTEEELDKDKKYDAFISFSHKDEEFVTDQLVPELENGPNPFKICLHFRDWVVGEYIPNQISKSVEDSRRTIIVLSANFMDSIWGRMEFRAAHQNALAEGRARVIVVILGEIGDIDKLDPELKVYLKTNTYVKWGDPWFFDKLRYALPHPTNYKSNVSIKSTLKHSIDDKLELIKPQAVIPPLTTPPAEHAGQNPLIGKLNAENAKYHSPLNGLNGHVNGAFIINTNAKQSDV